MKAVVLVGGAGTRLRPLTLTTPKQMLPVGGRPMIERVVEHLAGHGVDHVVLSLGYRPDAFIDAYPDGRCGEIALSYAVEDTPLDTAGAIAFAARRGGVDATFLVVNGDVLTDLDVSALVAFHRDHAAETTIALTPVADPSGFGVVLTDADGRVTAFIEKPSPGQAPTNLVNAGTYVCEPSMLERIPAGRPVSIERETFPSLVAGGSLYAMASSAPWTDVGTPERYLEANLALAAADGIASGVDPSATVSEAVLGAGVRIAAQATVQRAVLFDRVQVEPGAVVRDSIVGRDAVIGRGATVDALSVIGDGAEVTAGSVVRGARMPKMTP
ncbi:MAG TPA: NDP-sugar synthase [Acidimicrobiales bacterium]|nr:NDP-sugar synthase [Acidimicrobiales bacterium]